MERSWRTGLGVLAAVLLLNAVLVIGDFIEARRALVPSQLSLELAGLVGVFALASLVWRRARLPAPVLWGLGFVLLAVGLIRAADIVVPWSFGRYFNLAVDVRYLPVFFDMMKAAVPTTQFTLILVAGALGLVAAAGVLAYAVGVVWRGVARRQVAPFGVAALVTGVAWAVVPPHVSDDNFIAPPVAADMGLLTAKTSRLLAYNLRGVIAPGEIGRAHV